MDSQTEIARLRTPGHGAGAPEGGRRALRGGGGARAAHARRPDGRLRGDRRAIASTATSATRRRVAELDVLRRGAACSRGCWSRALLHHAAFRDRPLQPRPGRAAGRRRRLRRACSAPEIRRSRRRPSRSASSRSSVEAPLIGAVVMNLLANALKYGPRRRRHDRGSAPSPGRRGVADAASRARASRSRRGPRAHLPARTRGRGERRARGSGLGLAICREIVERHGGELGVVPVAGGNRFEFTLPAEPRE